MPNNHNTDFLKSMTFATAGKHLRLSSSSSCDCDECGFGVRDVVPASIREAIQNRKRQRLETGPIKRTQQRTFICRQHCEVVDMEVDCDDDDGTKKYSIGSTGSGVSSGSSGTVSLYSMTMPMNAEPLIEFGTSHRVIWVKQLPAKTSVIQSIGEGIIGSYDEEKTRKQMNDWIEGTVVLVVSTEGKAAGWIHTTNAHSDGNKLSTNEPTIEEPSKIGASPTQQATDANDPSRQEINENNVDNQQEEKKKATGSNDDSSTTSCNGVAGGGTYSTLYMCKIPASLTDDAFTNAEKIKKIEVKLGSISNHRNNNTSKNNDKDDESWAMTMIRYCRFGLKELQVRNKLTSSTDSASTSTSSSFYYRFDGDALLALKSAFIRAEKESSAGVIGV